MRVSVVEAEYAVVGSHPDIGSGILYWHDSDELGAYRDAREIRKSGGEAKVVSAPKGEVSLEIKNEVLELIINHLQTKEIDK